MNPTVIGACASASPDHVALPAPRPTAPARLINSRRLNPDCVMPFSFGLDTFLYTSNPYAMARRAFERVWISNPVHGWRETRPVEWRRLGAAPAKCKHAPEASGLVLVFDGIDQYRYARPKIEGQGSG